LIDTEHNGDVLLAKSHLVLYLCGCLYDVVDSLALGLLLFLEADLVLREAKLACPNLFLITFFHLLDLTVDVEDSLAFLAEGWVTSRELCIVLEG